MRRAAKIDRNQPEIVRALRQAGASVLCLHGVGQGCPDLLVGTRDRTFFLEVKDNLQPPSKQKLTPDEAEWHYSWRGEVYVVKTVAEALDILMET